MLSFWEKSSFTQYHAVVVGSGIVGLSTALSIRDKFPNWRIAVLEKQVLPTGASTKNAGFACVGSLTEILDDYENSPKEVVWDMIAKRKQGLELLRNRLGDATMQYQENGSYELLGEKEWDALDRVEEINADLYPIFGRNIFQEKCQSFGFSDAIKAVVSSSAEGELHTGKMMQGLLRLCREKDIEIITGYEVENMEENDSGVSIHHAYLPIETQYLFWCTNAFTQQYFPDLTDFYPGRGQVLITQPIPDLPFKGIFHMDRGYYYFREIDNRILIGGGRHTDLPNETTTQMELNMKLQSQLETLLSDVILPNRDIEVDMRWCGLMAFGSTKKPMVQSISSRQWMAVRLGGMGVALGSALGKELAESLERG